MPAEIGNRDLIHLRDLWATVEELREWRDDNAFVGPRLRPGMGSRLASLKLDQVRAIAKPGALEGLNGEAADALLPMVSTGAGPAEIVGARLEGFAVGGGGAASGDRPP